MRTENILSDFTKRVAYIIMVEAAAPEIMWHLGENGY